MTPAGTGRRQVNPERMTLVKKVHYALGALGLAPALGLLAAPTAANAATQSPARDGAAKTVSLNHRAGLAAATACTGITHHDTESHKLYLSFWSAKNAANGMDCIGTIEVRGVLHSHYPAHVSVWVTNKYGTFCAMSDFSVTKSTVFFGCNRSFRTDSLSVHAHSSPISKYLSGRYVSFAVH